MIFTIILLQSVRAAENNKNQQIEKQIEELLIFLKEKKLNLKLKPQIEKFFQLLLDGKFTEDLTKDFINRFFKLFGGEHIFLSEIKKETSLKMNNILIIVNQNNYNNQKFNALEEMIQITKNAVLKIIDAQQKDLKQLLSLPFFKNLVGACVYPKIKENISDAIHPNIPNTSLLNDDSGADSCIVYYRPLEEILSMDTLQNLKQCIKNTMDCCNNFYEAIHQSEITKKFYTEIQKLTIKQKNNITEQEKDMMEQKNDMALFAYNLLTIHNNCKKIYEEMIEYQERVKKYVPKTKKIINNN